jgi:hypothetical protein
MRLRSGYANAGSFLRQGAACESSRAIGDRDCRAIGDPILVLSGTGIEANSLAFNTLFGP